MYVRVARLLSLALVSASVCAQAAPHSHLRLGLAAEKARPGDEVLAALYFKMEPGWHIFWKNSGQPTLPTVLKWNLPAGVSAGEIQWPLPKKHIDRYDSMVSTSYIYEDEVALLVPLQIASNAAAGTFQLSAKIDWQECEKICVSSSSEIQAKIEIGSETKASA